MHQMQSVVQGRITQEYGLDDGEDSEYFTESPLYPHGDWMPFDSWVHKNYEQFT